MHDSTCGLTVIQIGSVLEITQKMLSIGSTERALCLGWQIGIAGRTGAGKSSILNSLFRLTPISEGSIVIDGVNTSHVALQRLRSRLTVVPQSPFLFGGSIR